MREQRRSSLGTLGKVGYWRKLLMSRTIIKLEVGRRVKLEDGRDSRNRVVFVNGGGAYESAK